MQKWLRASLGEWLRGKVAPKRRNSAQTSGTVEIRGTQLQRKESQVKKTIKVALNVVDLLYLSIDPPSSLAS